MTPDFDRVMSRWIGGAIIAVFAIGSGVLYFFGVS